MNKSQAKQPRTRWYPALLCLIAGLLFISSSLAAARAQEAAGIPPTAKTHHLFGSLETRNNNIDAFTKWTGVLERTAKYGLGETPGQPCRLGASLRCRTDEWKDFIAGLDGKSRMSQMEAVNHYINQSPYVTDITNWGINDYWETLSEFLTKDGDCEDYAIAKYYSLKTLGFDIANMRIVILEDENLHIPHAVLAVFMGSRIYILDNQIAEVVRDTSIVNYRPIYSINEQAWWFHRMPEPAFHRQINH